MKIIYFIYLFLLPLFSIAQKNVYGKYSDYFGSQLTLNPDFTFKYIWHFDLASSWSNGRWTIVNDTIYLTTVLVFDTLRFVDNNRNFIKDSLRLSDNSNGVLRIVMPQTQEFYFSELSGGGQNMSPCPNKLFYRNDVLYSVNASGKIITKKIKGFWSTKKYPPWYHKVQVN